MTQSIKQRTGALADKSNAVQLKFLMDAVRTELTAIRTTVDELVADHATMKTSHDAMETLIEELHDDHAVLKTLTDELILDGDASVADITAMRAAIVGITAKLDLDAGVTDTDYAATWDPAAQTGTAIAATALATITAAKPASGPATLSAAALAEVLAE
jgi:hypothetical protein